MESHETCPTNLGPRGRRRRWTVAAAMTIVAAAVLVAVHLTEAPRAWRLLVILPLLAASLGLFQAAAGT